MGGFGEQQILRYRNRRGTHLAVPFELRSREESAPMPALL